MHTNAYRRPLSPRPHPLHTHSRTHLGKNISARKRVRATDHPFPLSNQQMSNVSWLFSLPCAFPLSLPDARIVFVCERGGEVVVVQAGSSTAQDREKYLYRWFPLRKLFTGCSSLLIFCIMSLTSVAAITPTPTPASPPVQPQAQRQPPLAAVLRMQVQPSLQVPSTWVTIIPPRSAGRARKGRRRFRRFREQDHRLAGACTRAFSRKEKADQRFRQRQERLA